MATLKDFRDERLRKLAELKQLGVNPYPAEAHRDIGIGELLDLYEKDTPTDPTVSIQPDLSKFQNDSSAPYRFRHEVSICGRITGIRKFGAIAFISVRDSSGEIQLMFDGGKDERFEKSPDNLTLEDIHLLDTGDFIECRGATIRTSSGKPTLAIFRLRLLAKSLRPMPLRHEGFTDKEQRLRRRYIDTNVNEDVRQRYIRRSKFWTATRDFLNERGFLEINIPVLEHTTGGADANPFVTHMDALDQDFYLRISHELPLKRLIGGGYEKVYDIGPRFRNENYTEEHLPEHIAMEWYWAYANWEQGMQLMEDMFAYVLEKTFGTKQFSLKGFEIDFSKSWARLDYATVISDEYGIDVHNCTLEEVQKALKDHKLEVEKTDNIPRSIDKLWKRVRATHAGPSWLINTPLFISPLAKSNPGDTNTVQRFQAVIAGSELCNGYSELNDPIDQLSRFMEQEALRQSGDAEAQMLDIDYVEMLEYGMPPTCGLGFSERVFWIFEGVSAREGVPFPQMRSEIDEVTKSIYPDIKFD